MYPRRLRYRSSSITGLLQARPYAQSQVRLCSSHLVRPKAVYTKEQLQRRLNSTFQHERDGHHPLPKRSAIRPFWVFALCIPLGYALNWTSKSPNGSSSTTDGFIKYNLINKHNVSTTCSIFTLKPSSTSAIRTDDPALKRAITSVQFKQPQLQIARSYTLLPSLPGQDPTELRFLIRAEQNGEVSGYLHRLQLGAEIEVRGLSAEYVLPEKVDRVVFLAGGTGITPAMQVAKALAGEAEVHIMWANRRRQDCKGGMSDTQAARGQRWDYDLLGRWNPFRATAREVSFNNDEEAQPEASAIVSQLCSLQHSSSSSSPTDTPRNLSVDYFVDEENTFIQPSTISKLLQPTRPIPDADPRWSLLVVSGPEGFINHWAGPKQWNEGREVQGPLGGVLAGLDTKGWEVVKL